MSVVRLPLEEVARRFKNLAIEEGDRTGWHVDESKITEAERIRDLTINTIREFDGKGVITENKLIVIIHRRTGIMPNEIKNILTALHAEGRIYCRKIENGGDN
jgi:hypothetical protein